LRDALPISYVMDPVMIATSGDRLMTDTSMATLIDTLLPMSHIVTPNLHEAEAIANMTIRTEEDIHRALKIFVDEMGAASVIIKGGHLSGDATDYLYDGKNISALTRARIDTDQTHGTGCTFSGVLTAELAKGRTVEESFRTGKAYITSAIQNSP